MTKIENVELQKDFQVVFTELIYNSVFIKYSQIPDYFDYNTTKHY